MSDLAGDEEMSELVERFVGGLRAHATRLEAAFDASDREAVRRIAHQIKGAAGGYGFPTITEAAARLEQQARELENLDQALAEVCDMCRRARPSLHANDTRANEGAA